MTVGGEGELKKIPFCSNFQAPLKQEMHIAVAVLRVKGRAQKIAKQCTLLQAEEK